MRDDGGFSKGLGRAPAPRAKWICASRAWSECVLLGVWLLGLAACAPEPPPGRVLLVGIDGATLRLITPLVEEGRLPHIAELAAHGVGGTLRSEQPIYSPRIWNTIATGKSPEKHGIRGFVRQRENEKRRLFLSTDRTAHALWNIASDAGMQVGVVGWWNTFPPERIHGVMISDHARPSRIENLQQTFRVSDVPTGVTVYPEAWEDRVQQIQSEPVLVTGIPDPFRDDADLEEYLKGLLKKPDDLSLHYAEDSQTVRLALDIESALRPDLLMVFLPGIDRVSHVLWIGLEPDALYPEALRPTPAQRAACLRALRLYYVYTDALIGLLLERYGPDDLVVVVSDHGFEAGVHLGLLTGTHESEKALDGVFFARGPRIRAGAKSDGTSIYDVTPTVLAWLGLPVGDDMDGRPAPFLTGTRVKRVPTHDTHPVERLAIGASGREEEILKRLEDLGYIE